jgi:hypothetical protein
MWTQIQEEVAMLQMNEQRLLMEYHRHQEPAAAEKAERARQVAEFTVPVEQEPWLTCEVFDLLWQLGHLLEAAGLRLEYRYLPFHMRHRHA